MSESKRIAVVMSVYAGDKSGQVVEAVSSILAQTHTDFVLYLGCDGPLSDELKQSVSSFNDSRLNVVQFPVNRGLAHTLNSLIDQALEDPEVAFFARMDADDVSFQDRFEKQVQYFNQKPHISVLGAGCHEITESGDVVFEKRLPEVHTDLRRRFVKQCPLIHPTVMFRRRVFEGGIRYPVDVFRTEDLALWLELMGAGYEFANIQKPLLLFRVGQGFLKRRADRRKGWAEFKIRVNAIKRLGLPSAINILYATAQLGVKVSPPVLIGVAYRIVRGPKPK